MSPAPSPSASDRTLGKQLPSKRLKAGRENRERLQARNLNKANGRETLRGYVTMPILDDGGYVIGIRGHKMDKHDSGPEIITVGEEERGSVGDKETRSVRVGETSTNDTNEEEGEPTALAASSEPLTTASEPLTPAASAVGSQLQIEDSEIIFIRDDRRYRIRGLEKSRDELVHLDTLDLVKARSRASFIKAAATELYVDANTIKRDIGRMLLRLESLNKLAGYLAATSCKLDKPLAVVIQSSSSAGKTSLLDAVLSMMPEEDVQRFSGMTGQSLLRVDGR